MLGGSSFGGGGTGIESKHFTSCMARGASVTLDAISHEMGAKVSVNVVLVGSSYKLCKLAMLSAEARVANCAVTVQRRALGSCNLAPVASAVVARGMRDKQSTS
eukprot:scaffold239091_cov19-Tisochrysis_lutea.AAC.3